MGEDRASRPEEKAWRLFVAAEVPDAVRLRLSRELGPLRERHPELRWSPPENWHVTLTFLGAVRPQVVEEVRSGVEAAAARTERFETQLLGPGAFPSERRARVVWVGMSDPRKRFPALARELDLALARIVKAEERPFTAHLTVARAKQPVTIVEDLALLAEMRSDPFPVDRIVLYRSHLRRPAPVYEPVETFPLR